MKMVVKSTIWVLSLILSACTVRGQDFGIVYAENTKDPTQHGSYCMSYNPEFRSSTVPNKLDNATKYLVYDLTLSTEHQLLCKDGPGIPNLANKAVAVMRGNCTFVEKALLAEQHGAEAILVVSKTGLVSPGKSNETQDDMVNITIAVMASDEFEELQGLGANVTVQLYAPLDSHFDLSLLVIWLIATGTLAVGGLWSGQTRQKVLRAKGSCPSAGGEAESGDNAKTDQQTLDISAPGILAFVVLMSAMLLCLYFLFDYVVYVVMALFVIGASMAMYSCIKPFMLRLRFIPDCKLPISIEKCHFHRPEVRRIILALLCLGFGAWWFVERHASYAWILQDILGVVFCLYFMKTIRLPSFKICFIILICFMLYDVFFVFITPYMTKNGDSVMVEVAVGNKKEQLPMVLKIPRLSGNSAINHCMNHPFTILGFGDIILPGLLISYNYCFDLRVKSRGIYLASSVAAYAVGLVITFVGLALMTTGQPALMYLVPCTLLTTIVVAWCRKELRLTWRGDLKSEREPPVTKPEPRSTVTSPYANGCRSRDVATADNVSEESQLSDSEQPLLINNDDHLSSLQTGSHSQI